MSEEDDLKEVNHLDKLVRATSSCVRLSGHIWQDVSAFEETFQLWASVEKFSPGVAI